MDVAKTIMRTQVALLLPILFLASTRGQDHVTCERTFNKIGCFEEKAVVNTLLVNDRDDTSDKFQGHEVTWHDIENYLHSLACRCAVEAKKYGLEYFGIRYFGECYGGNVANINDGSKSPLCFQGQNYGACNDTNQQECGGKEFADYIYSLKDKGEKNVEGGYGEWGPWSGCSEECGGGKMYRTRVCDNPEPQGLGKDCSSLGNDTETAECGTMPCPVDGGFTEWSIFGSCSKTCGGGVKNRTRSCTNPTPANGGRDCVGPTEEIESCNMDSCPVNGGFSQWSSFGSCSVTCGKGLHLRERSCTNPPPSNGGEDCQGSYTETAECDAGGCPVDGGYGEWQAIGNCSEGCGGGEQVYQRKCNNPDPQHGGANCSLLGPAEEKRECNLHPCPIDGGFSEWTSFGNCSVSCGVGFKYRTRQCDNPAPAHGGRGCDGELRQAEECMLDHCEGNLALKKPTKQSSTGYGGASSRATDGIKTVSYRQLSCTHTNRDSRPWWRVDLGARHMIGKIRVTNRGDCCASRLRNVDVRVGDADSLDGNALCTHFPGAFAAGETKTLYCAVPITGRYIYISLRVKEWLTLCEVEAFSPDPANLARGKPTKQSSTYGHGLSSRAVDGNKASNFGEGSCTHTHKEQNPWWRVDLGSAQPVGEVVLTNRGDCCSERLRNIEIRVGDIDNDPSKNQICQFNHGAVGSGERRTFYCENVLQGRFVYVTLRADEYLTLCEIEVYKANLANLARGKPTLQSSTHSNGISNRAVDGNVDSSYGGGSCTHTSRELGAWWRVDLEASKNVGKVALVNRADCCSRRLRSIEIRVSDVDSPSAGQICHYRELPLRPGVKMFLYCSRPMTGRYVFVRLRINEFLTLCEVEVYTLKPGEKVDGGFSEWSDFGACSASCGCGVHYSNRTCNNPYPANGGAVCVGETRKSASCNTHKCPVNGGFSAWSSWGRCQTRCGAGTQFRTRLCNNPPPSHDGLPCRGIWRESRPCQSRPCPVHGGYSPWSSYGPCSVSCGHGWRVRTRKCNNPTPVHGGRSCARLGPALERSFCRRHRCPMPVSPPYYRRVCEHSTMNLACPVGSHIRITYAMYGRLTSAYCRRGWWTKFYSTKCRARSSHARVRGRCNNRRTCSVPAKNWLFGDPCVFTFKYLEVRYRCFGVSAPAFHAMVCERRQKVISCPFGRRIKITYAMYGRLNGRNCPYNKHKSVNNCRSRSSLVRTRNACDGRTTCILNANNAVYGDPCVSVYKYLHVHYRCIW